jgi:hypothetical protein
MAAPTRRTFLIASGAGAAAMGMAAVPAEAEGRAPDAVSVPLPHDATDLVAHVADPSSGMVTLLVGECEVVVYDRDLVARLARAASREP